MKRNNFEEQQWPRVNFSSQLKHNPFSPCNVSSSGDKRLYGTGGLGGVGNKRGGGREEEVGMGHGKLEGWVYERGRNGLCNSQNLSSCRRVSAAA